MVLYFAYGSNMSEPVVLDRAPTATRVGKARLSDHRIRFGRRSKRTGTGVADIVAAPGFMVMGVLYEVPEKEWKGILRKEGALMQEPAYRAVQVTVFSFADKKSRTATSFVVTSPSEVEQIPSADYLSAMITQAEDLKFPAYAAFLRWLRKRAMEVSAPPLREGLLVSGTNVQKRPGGHYLVRVNPRTLGKVKSRLATVEFDGRVTVAALDSAEEVAENSCEMDQNLRHALGMIGQNCYGYTAVVHPLSGVRNRVDLVRPRSLTLLVHQTNWIDSEKRICVLHERSLALLGIKEGEHVEILNVWREESGVLSVKRIKLRAHTSEKRADQPREYPGFDHVHLDRECRSELGFPADRSDFLNRPVLVRPSVHRLLQQRIAKYGVTFFLGIASLSQLLALFAPTLPSLLRGLMAIATAVLATVVVALLDIRASLSH
ncbi:gamma-glutamylcyclotransferase family protein [Amycolatopsis sp. NPDC049868]|uniref:gamma-glutamylcyclotransferase family protein n=1 Tax=Amycolatopsis sp. NPDC049868 TaxID=3363934 RepID=UPI0037BDA53A